MDQIFKSIKIIKKTRTPKVCRGCSKPIEVGSACLQTFEFLQMRFATDFFHTQACLLRGVKGFVKSVDRIRKSLKKYGIQNITIRGSKDFL
jgi:hypothetical protein